MTKLAFENCLRLNKDSSPISDAEITALKAEIPDWEIVNVDGMPRLRKTYKFKNFEKALEFTIQVGETAEEQGHHPLITLTWGQTTVDWWTHDIGGLHKNDFIMAAKSDALYD